MDGKTSNFRQEIRYSYYRNDPVKYDLNYPYVILGILGFTFSIIHLNRKIKKNLYKILIIQIEIYSTLTILSFEDILDFYFA